MRKIGFLVFLGALVTLALTGGGAVVAQDATALSAMRVEEGATDPFSSLWADAPALTVALIPTLQEEGIAYVAEVTLKALYNDSDLWIWASWPDASMNHDRGAWTWDGSGWLRNPNNEDRFGLAFNITGNAQFEAAGCFGACHIQEEPYYMGFEAGSAEMLDLWHWKAARTGPAGYADDQWIGAFVADAEEPTGRANDAREGGGYSDNVNEAGDGPGFVYPNGVTGGPLFADQAVPVDPGADFPVGYTVPGYRVSRAVGSRGDIAANAVYARNLNGSGAWYVVLHRALDTGNPDDAAFGLDGSYGFGVTVFDNAADYHHAVNAGVLRLVIGP